MRVVVRLRMRLGPNPPTVELEAPPTVPHHGVQSDLRCSADESLIAKFRQAAPDAVDTVGVGARVYDALTENPGVKAALERLVLEGDGEVVLDILGDEIERLPWESLYQADGERFLALKRWPIERRVSDVMKDDPREVVVGDPIRVAAVLAAASYDAIEQWRALEALYDGPANVKLFVAASDRSVREAVMQRPEVELHTIQHEGKRALWDAIAAFDPQVLHLFCHGDAGSDPFLSVATILDKKNGEKGSIPLFPSDLLKMTSDAATLAVLGCCEGAAPSETSRAFCRLLVKERFHAAIGMSERTEFTDLDALAAVFYPRLGQRLTTPHDAFPWRELLTEPRQKLGAPPRDETSKRWVAPVLFARATPLRLLATPLSSETLDRIAELEGFLAVAPSAAVRAAVTAEIDRLRKGGA